MHTMITWPIEIVGITQHYVVITNRPVLTWTIKFTIFNKHLSHNNNRLCVDVTMFCVNITNHNGADSKDNN